jgi:hypothetical protein
MPGEPLGYKECSNWDTLAWNWKINIHNGRYAYFTNGYFHMQTYQKQWDSTCVLCDSSEMLPKYPNREDLLTYGYKNGSTQMRKITSENWLQKMKEQEGKYVRDVRGYKYAKPWQ